MPDHERLAIQVVFVIQLELIRDPGAIQQRRQFAHASTAVSWSPSTIPEIK
jgi:hypothetical protein